MSTTGCLNTATFQSAEVVGHGESAKGIGITYVETGDREFDDGSVGRSFSLPIISGWHRHGLTERLEIRGMYSIGAGLEGGVKYGMSGYSEATGGQLSLGSTLRLGGMRRRSPPLEDGARGDTAWEAVLDAIVPVYVGYRFSDRFALSATPHYALRTISGIDNEITHLVGSNVGLEFGTNGLFFIDLMGGYDIRGASPLFSVGVATSR